MDNKLVSQGEKVKRKYFMKPLLDTFYNKSLSISFDNFDFSFS